MPPSVQSNAAQRNAALGSIRSKKNCGPDRMSEMNLEFVSVDSAAGRANAAAQH